MSKQYFIFEKAISKPRLGRYLRTTSHNKTKAMALYRANLVLSQNLFAVMSIFEISLRNAIDTHYRQVFLLKKGSSDWFLSETSSTGFLSDPSLAKITNGYETKNLMLRGIKKLGKNYTPDKAICEFTFGLWRYFFAPRQFFLGGATLLKIFPKRPKGVNQKDVFKKLERINAIRNRIAHHEPICFGVGDSISIQYAESHYLDIIEMLEWLDLQPSLSLKGIDKVMVALKRVYNLK
jgi:Abi-like protein